MCAPLAIRLIATLVTAFWSYAAQARATLTTIKAPQAGLQISQQQQGVVVVTTGRYRWEISTNAFDVVHHASVGGQQRLFPGRASVEALGSGVTFGPPDEVKAAGDWVELRGWADRGKHLWYVARYQFFPERPFARLVLTLVDRHDRTPASEPWEPYWNDRVLSRWKLEIGAPGGKPTRITQHNSYSYSEPGQPWVEVVDASGAPYQWAASPAARDGGRFELAHGAKDGANQVIWHPMVEGNAELTALVSNLTGGWEYRAAKSAVYEVVDASGRLHSKTVAQTSKAIALGTYALSKSSVVRLKATGGGEELTLAGPLRIAPAGRPAFEIPMGARHDGLLGDGPSSPVALALKDFWQHHPVSLVRTDKTIGWEAIERPEQYSGGMGLTLETMISIDGAPKAALQALEAPPATRTLPKGWDPVDGSMAGGPIGARYDALIKTFAARCWRELEALDSFGWKNWGDYQIGVSYTAEKGQVEDWANLQYDLPSGLLLAWMRTGDPNLWRFAQASVRHLMDIDLVKFYPFMDKLNGLVYRKGETRRSRSHFDAEPITDQGFAFRSLLLYHHLTGEQWARDLAKQNIDRLVYYATTRPHFVLNGDRPTAWMLRAAIAGAEHFADDPSHNYQQVADTIVKQLVEHYKSNKHLPGIQPVWQAQMLEGLAKYHRKTGRADVAEVIVGHVRYLLTDCVRRKPDGKYELMYCYSPGGKYCPEPQWTDEDNYPFMWLSSITYAYQLTREQFFADWADTLFKYAEPRMSDHPDIRSWTSVLGFPHLYVDQPPKAVAAATSSGKAPSAAPLKRDNSPAGPTPKRK